MEKLPELSNAQCRVLAYIGKGWQARVSHGSAVEVNGKRVCNVDTMMALHRLGLAEKNEQGLWVSTESGREAVRRLAL